jgi:hypothetical protein
MDSEEMRTSEIQAEPILRDEETSVPPALGPGAMFIAPHMGAIIAPILMSSLPAAAMQPTSLLLPGLRLLLGALRISSLSLLVSALLLLGLLLRDALWLIFRASPLL